MSGIEVQFSRKKIKAHNIIKVDTQNNNKPRKIYFYRYTIMLAGKSDSIHYSTVYL